MGLAIPSSKDGFVTGNDTHTFSASSTYNEGGIKYLSISKASIKMGYQIESSDILPNALDVTMLLTETEFIVIVVIAIIVAIGLIIVCGGGHYLLYFLQTFLEGLAAA